MTIASLIGSIATTSALIQSISKIDIMFSYNSSAELFNLRVFNKGWLTDQEPDEDYQLWLDESEANSIEKLMALNSHLIEKYASIKQEVA